MESDDNIALCAPLAILVSAYREQFPEEVYADTLHAMFNVPVQEEQEHFVNYRLGYYDLLLVELCPIERHIKEASKKTTGDCRRQREAAATIGDSSRKNSTRRLHFTQR